MSMGGGDWERVLERWGTGRRVLNPGSTVHWGFPGGIDGKASACNVGGLGSIPGLGRSPGEGKGYPLQYSGLENSILNWLESSFQVPSQGCTAQLGEPLTPGP